MAGKDRKRKNFLGQHKIPQWSFALPGSEATKSPFSKGDLGGLSIFYFFSATPPCRRLTAFRYLRRRCLIKRYRPQVWLAKAVSLFGYVAYRQSKGGVWLFYSALGRSSSMSDRPPKRLIESFLVECSSPSIQTLSCAVSGFISHTSSSSGNEWGMMWSWMTA